MTLPYAPVKKTRFFLDTEFIEDGRTIDLLSIGIVREDGATYYAVSSECDAADRRRANDWVRENVLPQIDWDLARPREVIRAQVLEFVGDRKPAFWGWYADYDWVALCQLFGRMIDLPDGWPMFCRDLRQWADDLGNPELPGQKRGHHHALQDALWIRDAHAFLAEYAAKRGR